jgi:hypothetical protein
MKMGCSRPLANFLKAFLKKIIKEFLTSFRKKRFKPNLPNFIREKAS